MDAEELSGILTTDFIFLTFVTGILVMAHSKLILTLREMMRRLPEREGARDVAQCQVRLAIESGLAAPVVWQIRAGELADRAALACFLGCHAMAG